MMWRPWTRYRRAAEAARADAAKAEAEKRIAAQRKQAAQRQDIISGSVSAALRREIDKNGWTELLQHAWGGR